MLLIAQHCCSRIGIIARWQCTRIELICSISPRKQEPVSSSLIIFNNDINIRLVHRNVTIVVKYRIQHDVLILIKSVFYRINFKLPFVILYRKVLNCFRHEAVKSHGFLLPLSCLGQLPSP
ncbi:hypothetical protein D3C87_1519010 [compost metagenome]